MRTRTLSSHLAPFWCKRLVVLRCEQVEQHREQGTKVHAVTGFLSAEHYFCKVCGVYTHHKRRRYPDQISVNFACLDGLDFPEEINISEVTNTISLEKGNFKVPKNIANITKIKLPRNI